MPAAASGSGRVPAHTVTCNELADTGIWDVIFLASARGTTESNFLHDYVDNENGLFTKISKYDLTTLREDTRGHFTEQAFFPLSY